MRAKGVLNLPSCREEELLQDYAFTPLLCKTFSAKHSFANKIFDFKSTEDFVSFFL